MEELLKMLLNTISESELHSFVVIDAVESVKDQPALLQVLQRLLEINHEGKLHILVASQSSMPYRFSPGRATQLTICNEQLHCDITNHILRSLQRTALRACPTALQLRIHQKLHSNPGPSFRLAQCQLVLLSRCHTPRNAAKSLATLPNTVEDCYRKTMDDLPHSCFENAVALLQWLVIANKAFSLNEVHSILELHSGRILDAAYMHDLLTSLHPLVITIPFSARHLISSATNQYVRLSHLSVREYLSSDPTFAGLELHESIYQALMASGSQVDCEGRREELRNAAETSCTATAESIGRRS